MLYYAVTAAPPTDYDVVQRRLTVTVNGVSQGTRVYGPTTTDLGEVAVLEGSEVVLVLQDLDDADNLSEPAEVSFVAADTLPPARPGLEVTLVREDPPVKAEEAEEEVKEGTEEAEEEAEEGTEEAEEDASEE